MPLVESNKTLYASLDHPEVLLVFHTGSVYVCAEIKVPFSTIASGMASTNLGLLILFRLISFLHWFSM